MLDLPSILKQASGWNDSVPGITERARIGYRDILRPNRTGPPWYNSDSCYAQNPRSKLGPYKTPNTITFKASSQAPGEYPGEWDYMDVTQLSFPPNYDHQQPVWQIVTHLPPVDAGDDATFFIWLKNPGDKRKRRH